VTLRAAAGVRLQPGRLVPAATSLRSGRVVAAAVTVRARATIEGFDIDAGGNGIDSCDGTEPVLAGVFLRGAGTVATGNAVRGVRIADAPPGCVNGVGVLAEGTGRGSLRVEGNTVTDYARAGIVVDAPGGAVRVRQNLVVGDGAAATAPAQVGIEVTAGDRVRLDENVVREQASATSGACGPGVGISLDAPRVRLQANQLVGNAVGIHAAARGHRLADDVVDGGAPGLIGLWLTGDETRVARLIAHGHATTGVLVDGNRNTLRATTTSGAGDAPLCAGWAPCIAATAERCGIGLWLRGRANRLTTTTALGVDAPVVDDGRANAVR
jgi:hypothetical protein